ncbi:nucleolar protein,Nop52-domain-containing protein [Kickxella alabastrina]|uniref:nucleolar protein,Nop52-domain-containing protein n=1 Tax=Kickxella alabastrina TaxID=61397 RepID=UPI00221F73D3|nr:nucleolar protein,Nop52-domain-containing protein [Kickxella alabastrina]KAI7829180.1 nucleolar protein,Nop52-domain-containing protein [Kickxella alabastrina]
MIELTENEVAFGKRLAHVDKEVRDLAIEKFGIILSREEEFTHMEMVRHWKALFYCFWLSDMPLVQQELSWDLANMVLKCQGANRVQFVRAFWETISREWFDIDKHRIDKYLLLIRRMVFFTFRSMHQSDWNEQLVREYIDVYYQFPINPTDPKVPNSTRSHIADVYVDELVRLSTEILKSSDEDEAEAEVAKIPVTTLLEPFMRFIGTTTIKHLPPQIQESVFENMVIRIADAEERANNGDNASDSESEGIVRDNQIEHETLDKVQFLIDSMSAIKERIFAVASEESMRAMGRRRLYALYQILCDTFPNEDTDVPLQTRITVNEPIGAQERKIANKHKRKREAKKVERKQKKKDLATSILKTEAMDFDINALENLATVDEERKFQDDIVKIREMDKRAGLDALEEACKSKKSKKNARAEKKKQTQQIISEAAVSSAAVDDQQEAPELIAIEPVDKRSPKKAKAAAKRAGADSVNVTDNDGWEIQDRSTKVAPEAPSSGVKRRRNSDQTMLAEALKNIVVHDRVAAVPALAPVAASAKPTKGKAGAASNTPVAKDEPVANGKAIRSDKKKLTWALERNTVKRFLKKVPMLPSTDSTPITPENVKPALRKQSAYSDEPDASASPLKPVQQKQPKKEIQIVINGQTSTPQRGNKRQKRRA